MKNILMIAFDNISKSYGSRLLFNNVTFNVNHRERIGLIGRNGYGKTTILRIITGTESIDSGKLLIPKNYTIGYLKQHINFTEKTVISEAIKGLPKDEKSDKWKAEKILVGLGFNKEEIERAPNEFSGGYQIRIMLTQVLLSKPNMLLLDEPTNYLDILSIRWLKNFLISWSGELILITHDRQFMDDIITHTVGIHRGKVRKIEGKTEKFYEQIAKDEETYEKTRINDEQKRKELEQYIRRFRAKARLAGLVQSRVKTLNKITKKEKLEAIKNLEFSFRYKPFNAKQIMRAENISFGYENNLLINNFSITVGSEDKICIIGKNGKGKSTLLRILAGKLKANSGNIIYHTGIAKGHFEQTNTDILNPQSTVEEEIQSVSADLDRTVVRNICGSMLFRQDDALKKISLLSGGEKSRVILGKIIATPLNLILMDEPTNHFDMDSSDGLMEAINSFQGSVIMVTHNEMFLHGLANRLIVFQGDTPELFDGTYEEFLEKVGWQDDTNKDKAIIKSKQNKKDIRRLRSEIITEKNKILKPIKDDIDSLELIITSSEDQINKLNTKALELTLLGDGKKIGEIGIEINNLETNIENAFTKLDEKSTLYDNLVSEYNKRLEILDED